MRKSIAVLSIVVVGMSSLYLYLGGALPIYATDVDSTISSTYEINNVEYVIGQKVTAKKLITNAPEYKKVVFADGKDIKQYEKAGVYTESIVLTDTQGGTEKRDVTFNIVPDKVKPTLKGVKSKTVYVSAKVNYLKGITASDNIDGNLTDKIKVNKSKVNLKKAGTYKIRYMVTDSSKNVTSKVATIKVIRDAKPVLKGVKSKVVYIGSKVNYLKGVTAKDKRDGNLTRKIKVNKSKVNIKKAGIYVVTYSVIDSSKNKTQKKAKIIVKSKEYSPEDEAAMQSSNNFVLKAPKLKEGKDVNGNIKAGGKQGVGYW